MQSDINFTFLNEILHVDSMNGRVEYNCKIILLLGYKSPLGTSGLVWISHECFSATGGDIQSQGFLTSRATQAVRTEL